MRPHEQKINEKYVKKLHNIRKGKFVYVAYFSERYGISGNI
jgi:hypothetical protein